MHIQFFSLEELSFSGGVGFTQPRLDSFTANKQIKQLKSLSFGISQKS